MAPPKVPWPVRFWTKVLPVESGCWEWQAFRDKNGYGQFGETHGKSRPAHRFAYRQFVGPIPAGLLVMHTCDNPPCVRLDHLRLGTYKENTADMIRKGRRPGNGYREMTHCRRGHPLSGNNLGFQANGVDRRCIACTRITSVGKRARYYAKQKAIKRVFHDSKKESA